MSAKKRKAAPPKPDMKTVVVTSEQVRKARRGRIGPFTDADMQALLRKRGIDPNRIESATLREIDGATIYVGARSSQA